MASTPHDGLGTTFTFDGTTFTVSNVQVSFSDVSGKTDRIDISNLSQTTGETMLTMARPLIGSATGDTGKEISFDFIGTDQLEGGTSGAYALTGPVALSGSATIVSSNLTLSPNDAIRGNATVRVS